MSRVWGHSSSDVFAVGAGGAIVHYDGVEWTVPAPSQTAAFLYGVWGSSPDDVFAVGEGGTIRHFDGVQWFPQSSGTSTLLGDVWGTAPDDVFAVGDGGVILHYDGISWSPQASGSNEFLQGVWGTAPDDVYAVGTGGIILHYDGNSWSPQASGSGEYLGDIWGSAPDDIFVVGFNGSILHFDGVSWSLDQSQAGRALGGIWGSSGTDVFAVDYQGAILHYDGAVWSEVSPAIPGCWGIWGSSGSDVFVATQHGRILHFDGAKWTIQETPETSANPTLRIGDYNGLVVAGDRVSAVWCGTEANASGDPIAQQTLFDQIDLGLSAVDPNSQDRPGSFSGLILRQNHPNPFQARTSIEFALPAEGRATLRIYDVRGHLVRELLNQQLPRDVHTVVWDGRDSHGRTIASGTYWYRLTAGGETVSRLLIRYR
jgi:hypothetical protein